MEMQIVSNVDYMEMRAMMKDTGRQSAVECMRDALSFYQWAIDASKGGHIIISVLENGSSPNRMEWPPLQFAKLNGQQN